MKNIKKIGVFTSGGDSPGMNAAVRAVVRFAKHKNLDITGIRYGYEGMINKDFIEFEDFSVSNIIHRGGTILKSARSSEFRESGGREVAVENLRSAGIEGLVAIGGDGTFRGSEVLSREYDIPVVGVPGTIDNDLYGTDETIGYDTALNTAVEAIDKIRDTADAHDRLFLVEVMGRDAGFLALETGISGGAEMILIPERKMNIEEIKKELHEVFAVQRRSTLVVIAEGNETGGALKLSKALREDFEKYEMRVGILGHMQRGGNPTARDRVLASRLGAGAVRALINGKSNVMTGLVHDKIVYTPFHKTWEQKKTINNRIFELAKILS